MHIPAAHLADRSSWFPPPEVGDVLNIPTQQHFRFVRCRPGVLPSPTNPKACVVYPQPPRARAYPSAPRTGDDRVTPRLRPEKHRHHGCSSALTQQRRVAQVSTPLQLSTRLRASNSSRHPTTCCLRTPYGRGAGRSPSLSTTTHSSLAPPLLTRLGPI